MVFARTKSYAWLFLFPGVCLRFFFADGWPCLASVPEPVGAVPTFSCGLFEDLLLLPLQPFGAFHETIPSKDEGGHELVQAKGIGSTIVDG